MSKGTMQRLSVRYFRTAVDNLNVEETQTGSRIIRAIPVFRSGTFKDSWGDPHTWETEHLEQMVFNFSLLRNRGILPDVPVRDDHRSLFGGGGATVGYVADLYTVSGYEDGYTRLLADLEITEPDAYAKIERGTWRGRSAEIGFYETNDEVMYWPVFMGVAWVDIPAVEGLFSNHNTGNDKFTPIRDQEQEEPVGTKQTKKHSSSTPPEGEGEGTPPTNDGGGEGTPPANDGGGEGEGDPTPDPTTQHSHPSGGGTLTFSVNGTPTSDFAAVQRHITALEEFRDETQDQGRKDFVKGLAEKGLIAATQVDAMTEHALGLNGKQWADFKKMYPEDAAPAALFQRHGTDGSESHPSGDEGPSEIDTLRETVAMHRRAEMPEARIKETKSYKRLMELTDGNG